MHAEKGGTHINGVHSINSEEQGNGSPAAVVDFAESRHLPWNFLFGKNISPAIVEDMDGYLKENQFRIRNEAGVISDYYKSTNQDYIVHCELREGKTVLLDLSLSVPDREQAESMCSQWEQKNQEIYSIVMKSLMNSSN